LEITSVAKAMRLSQKSVDRIEKSHKMVPQMAATVAFYLNTIDAMIEEQTLDPNRENLVKTKLIPIQYLKIASEKMQKAEDKHAVTAIYKNMIEELENDLTWLSLPSDEKLRLEKFAKECAVIFQRSSSCVEGRNSHLGLWYHGVNHLSERKQKVIRIVHNYYIKRWDHTTAAERFFEKKPRNLFLHLLEKMPYPERPRNRSVAANDAGFAMAM
jgi:hypothetical protein